MKLNTRFKVTFSTLLIGGCGLVNAQGIRVPSMISWPGKIPESQVLDQFAVN